MKLFFTTVLCLCISVAPTVEPEILPVAPCPQVIPCNSVSSSSSRQEASIRMEVLDYQNSMLTVLLSNYSGHTMTYSDAFSLQQKTSDGWVILVPDKELSSSDVLYTISDLNSIVLHCDLSAYGVLSAGTYRFVKEDATAEFTLR